MQTRLKGVEREKKEALEKLDMIQKKSSAFKEEIPNVETNKGRMKAESLQGKVDAAEERSEKMNAAHLKTIATLNDQIADLQKKLAIREGARAEEVAQEHAESGNGDDCPCFWCPELFLTCFRKGSTGDRPRRSAVTPLSLQI